MNSRCEDCKVLNFYERTNERTNERNSLTAYARERGCGGWGWGSRTRRRLRPPTGAAANWATMRLRQLREGRCGDRRLLCRCCQHPPPFCLCRHTGRWLHGDAAMPPGHAVRRKRAREPEQHVVICLSSDDEEAA